MRKLYSYLLTASVTAFVVTSAHAGLITHSDYQSGATITATGQNANENAIFNEFNGNIDNNNIKSGGVVSANIAANTIATDRLNTVLVSSFSAWNAYASYRRPVLQYSDSHDVDLENNTTTSFQSCVLFPDGVKLCVTENLNTTQKYRRWSSTATAQFTSGTEDSGPFPSTCTVNTSYMLYAVKSQINAANFVIAGSTNLPTQYDNLNAMFGANRWVYLGAIFYGDNSNAPETILKFTQTGSFTSFYNAVVTGTAFNNLGRGIKLAQTASATSLTWTYSGGTQTPNLPQHLNNLVVEWGSGGSSGDTSRASDSAANFYFGYGGVCTSGCRGVVTEPANIGLQIASQGPAAQPYTILLTGYYDSILYGGPFGNP